MRAVIGDQWANKKKAAKKAIPFALALSLSATLWMGAMGQASADAPYKTLKQSFVIGGVSSNISVLNSYDTTYVGLRMLNDKLGLRTAWNKADDSVTVEGNGRKLVLGLKSGDMTLNGQKIYGLPPIVNNDSTYLPLRFLLERMGYEIVYNSTSKGIEITKLEENAVGIETGSISYNDAAKRLELSVNYPRVTGLASEAAQRKINDYLKQEAESQAEAGKKQLLEAASQTGEWAVEFSGTYTVSYNEQGLLSLYVDYYVYSGGAHGGTLRVPYTFDLATGSLLTLKEAAKGNPNYVSIINNAIKAQLKSRGLDQDLIAPFETIEPDRPFYLNHNGLVIAFQQYEYLPYAAGIQEFVIPLKSFE
ncbi:stalk domain-containing protein [Cohnella thailandensis]|uniref:DUF4163 domain-containing protein n=1 Tax=Cohnella thailandensis TaxID=557557 RepID=A0A841T604_9BACL|nr:DUF4163 domain-containing protein [Cohnella thailandensis]MBB6637738.1 DUF4163 domain-containing protein [Cohnella thailandensis]MBP1974085.1 hypothetical protein [Cohnella thailandensis]